MTRLFNIYLNFYFSVLTQFNTTTSSLQKQNYVTVPRTALQYALWMQQYTVHKWKLVNWVYIYRQQTAKICVTEDFCCITNPQLCNASSQHGSIIFRSANTLYCADGKIRHKHPVRTYCMGMASFTTRLNAYLPLISSRHCLTSYATPRWPSTPQNYMCQTKLPSSRTTNWKHLCRRYLPRLPSWTTSDLESRYLAESSTWFHFSARAELQPDVNNDHIGTLSHFIMYSLKSYTHKMITRCMTRQNTSSQNTEPNPVHETSCTSRDENAPDAKIDERQVVFSVYPNLSP